MFKILTFLKEAKSEISKVVWPSREQTFRYTIVVIVFSLIISIILGAADYGLVQLLQKIINR
ncbi:preprotein translocase subunit SecE [Patescibacteria group bacterium]|nr:preprotein translocase subunit SecE [Patescibacteria group bacterium]